MIHVRDRLSIRSLRVDCIVGVGPRERQSPQPVVVDVHMGLHTGPAARLGRLRDTVDYARVAGEIRFLLQSCRFHLLESAAEAIAAWLCVPASADAPRAQVLDVEVQIDKPLALAGAAIPSLNIRRIATDLSPEIHEKATGYTDLLFATRECAVYRERLRPGASVPGHFHAQVEQAELILGSGLLVQGRPAEAGTARRWPRLFPHRYENPTRIEQSILCIDRPGVGGDLHLCDTSVDVSGDVEAERYFFDSMPS